MNIKAIYGIDFSGAKNAGKKIWVSRCEIKNKKLKVKSIDNAVKLFGVGSHRDDVLPALAEFISSHSEESLFAIDFPFGIAEDLVDKNDWEDFVLNFLNRFKTAKEFRAKCMERTGGKETKRISDIPAKTPFNSFNIRIFRQTYYGISKVLHPLVKEEMASILPMGKVRKGKPKVIEICPASTLKYHNVYSSYKGNDDDSKDERIKLVEFFESKRLDINSTLRDNLIDDPEGDGIDSLAAAYAAFHHLKNDTLDTPTRNYIPKEGYIYI